MTIQLIFEMMAERIKCLTNKKTLKQKLQETPEIINQTKHKWLTFPYFKGVSEQFKNLLNNIQQKVTFYNMNKLNQFIKVYKDSLPDFNKINVLLYIKLIVRIVMHPTLDKLVEN